jgi:hypothetical protein
MPQAYLRHRDFVSYSLLHTATLQYLDACIFYTNLAHRSWIDPFAHFLGTL